MSNPNFLREKVVLAIQLGPQQRPGSPELRMGSTHRALSLL